MQTHGPSLMLILLVLLTPTIEAQEVNKGSTVLQTFESNVAGYMKLRKEAAAGLPKLKPTPSAEQRRFEWTQSRPQIGPTLLLQFRDPDHPGGNFPCFS